MRKLQYLLRSEKMNGKCCVLHSIGEADKVFKSFTIKKTTLEAQ